MQPKFIEVITATGVTQIIRIDKIEAIVRNEDGSCKIFFSDDLSTGFDLRTLYKFIRDQLKRNDCYVG